MQAWWTFTGYMWKLENSFNIPVSFLTHGSCHIGPLQLDTPQGKTIEEVKAIVAHKFATMLAEQAVAVLTIGA